jgi:hypothetical protein
MRWLFGRDQHYQQKANSSYTKQYSNPYGPMEFRYVGTASNYSLEILHHFQSKTLLSILYATWYINSHRINEDLQVNAVLSDIKKWSAKYLSKL